MGRKFELIVFGASGFTGTHVVENIVQLTQTDRKSLTWAVAGRSQKKLTDSLKEVSKETGVDLSKVVTIEADVSNVASLRRMAAQGSVVLNCVGPYQLFGENVVKACIAEGTHHVDLSGEPQFSEKMQVYYHKEAEDKNAYIVGSCGFDSIPSDVGIAYLQQKFEGDLNSVEMFFETKAHGKRPKIHYGTWHSLIHIINKMGELKALRKLLFPKPLPTPKYELEDKGLLHKSDKVNTWCVPFVGTDIYVVNRSQYHFHHVDKLRPVQMTAYLKIHYFILGLIGLIGAGIIATLCKFEWGVKLLENYPRLCSLGAVSHEGSSREVLKSFEFKFTFMGEGWKDKTKGPNNEEHSGPPNKKMNLIVKGRDPGYSGTSIMMVQSALTILEESSRMPSKGGVYPPGAAFAKTTLVDRLNSKGITFTLETPK